MIDLVIDMKQRNPCYGYRRIAIQIYQSFGIKISYFAVGASVEVIVQAIDNRMNDFFVDSLQLDAFTLGLEYK